MYSNVKSVQLLVAALKAKEVKNIVISAGTSHDAIIRSIEEDGYFKTFNIVDERSASFFALGIIQETSKPVAIICTSGTATSNYMSGVTEAYKRKLPLIVITADKNPYYLNQLEEQMIDQVRLFDTNTKYNNTLPIVRDKKDEWYCQRIINEALLELDHHGKGPVHLNIPIEEGMFAIDNTFTTEELPKFNLIDRIDYTSDELKWKEKFEMLKGKKVLIIFGQEDYFANKNREKIISSIFDKYNCVFAVDKLSNLHCKGTLEVTRASKQMSDNGTTNNVIPDVVINLGGNNTLDIKFPVRNNTNTKQAWLVSEEGIVQDFYRKLSTIFECSIDKFLEEMNKYEIDKSNSYYDEWIVEEKKYKEPTELEYSNLYAVKELMKNIPKESNLNLANSTTIRIAEYFDINNSIPIYCNRGVNGIDGSMSTFIGQSAISDKLNFLIIGDLSFFYDMNALWNRYVGKNVRIMLNNNSGASLFHFNQGLKKFPTLNENVAADHDGVAKGWVESRGFEYLSATNKNEFDKALKKFVNKDSEKPIFLEVFTKKEADARIQHEFYDYNIATKSKVKSEMKNIIKNIIGR